MVGPDAMIADVIAHPDDDAPRLVYADWLLERDEQRDRERGEFIQLSCSLHRHDEAEEATRGPIVRRAMELLGRRELEWVDALLAPLPRRRRESVDVDWRWSRGFIERYRPGGQNGDFRLGELEQVRRHTPIRDVSVALAGDLPTRSFLDRPWLSSLRALTVDFRVLPDLLATFFDSRALHGLRHLAVRFHEQRQVHVLAQHTAAFTRLESFELSFPQGRIEPGTFEAIAALPFGPKLKHFGWGLATGIDELVQLPFPLESLAVDVGGSGEVLRELISRTRAFPSLRTLELDRGHSDLPSWSFNELDELVRSRGGFKGLRLRSPKEGPGFERLIARRELETLESLSLTGGIAFGDHEAEALAAATHLTALRELDLSRQQITSLGAKALIAAPQLQRLRRLSLHHNQRIGAAAFAAARGLQELEWLDLRHNSIQVHGPATERLRQRFGGAVRVADDPA